MLLWLPGPQLGLPGWDANLSLVKVPGMVAQGQPSHMSRGATNVSGREVF